MKKHQPKKEKDFSKKYIILIIAVIAALYLVILLQSQHLIWDEYVYLSNAKSHVSGSNFVEDFRFPLLEYVISGVWFITGESVLIAQLFMMLFSLLSVFIVYLLAKKFLENKILQLIAPLFFGLSNIMLFWSFRIYTDIPAMCMMLLSIYFFIEGMEGKENKIIHKYFFLSGITACLAFLFRFPIILFILPLVFIILIKRTYKEWMAFAIGGLIPLLPWLLANFIAYGNPIWDLTAQGGAVATYTAWQSPQLLLTSIITTTSITLLLFIPFLFRWIKKRKQYHWHLLGSIIVLQLIFYLFFVRLKLPRYQLMFLPLLVIALVVGAEELLNYSKKRNSKKILLAILVLGIFFVIILSSMTAINEAKQKVVCETNSSLQQSIAYATQHIPSEDVISSNNWPPYGFYGNHHVTSTWTTNISELIAQSETDWIIFVSGSGLVINKQQLDNHSKLQQEIAFNDQCNKEVIIYKVIK